MGTHRKARGLGVADLFVRAGCVLILLMMLHIVLDVAGKYLFNTPLPGTTEVVSAYYMVGVLFLPLGYVAQQNDHIFVELFTQGLSPRALRRLEAATGIAGAAAMALVAWLTALEAIERTVSGETWETAASHISIWPSRWLLPVGCATMAVYMAARTISGLRAEGPDR